MPSDGTSYSKFLLPGRFYAETWLPKRFQVRWWIPICAFLRSSAKLFGFLRKSCALQIRRLTKGWFSKRVVLADVPPEREPERGCIRMFPRNENQNEATFACSPGTKTGTRAHSPKPPFYETALVSPSENAAFLGEESSRGKGTGETRPRASESEICFHRGFQRFLAVFSGF